MYISDNTPLSIYCITKEHICIYICLYIYLYQTTRRSLGGVS